MAATTSLLPVEPREVILISNLEEILRERNLHSVDSIVRQGITDLNGKPISKEEKQGFGCEIYNLDIVLDLDVGIAYRFQHPFLEVNVFQTYGTYYVDRGGRLNQQVIDENLKADDPNLVRFFLYSKMVAQAREIEDKLGLKPRTKIVYKHPKRRIEVVNLNRISPEVERAQARYKYIPEPFSHERVAAGDILQRYDPVYGFSTSRDPLIARLHELRKIS